MNNEQIITEIAVLIFGKEIVDSLIKNGKEIPLHTAKGWKDRGYSIKKEEIKNGIEARLWKKKKHVEGTEKNAYYKAKSFLFRPDQVAKEDTK